LLVAAKFARKVSVTYNKRTKNEFVEEYIPPYRIYFCTSLQYTVNLVYHTLPVLYSGKHLQWFNTINVNEPFAAVTAAVYPTPLQSRRPLPLCEICVTRMISTQPTGSRGNHMPAQVGFFDVYHFFFR
jgi:hypothetical protein